MEASLLKVWSIGKVASNKKLGEWEVEVTATEVNPMIDGELNANANSYTAKAEDEGGGAYSEEVTTSNTITAKWLPVGQPNRMTPPDVRRGEEVILYRFGNAEQIYWNTYRNDLAFRKLETVVWAISGTAEEGPMDQSKTYFIEVSSHKGLLHIHTSKENGEPYMYDIRLNTTEGIFEIMDDIGNRLKLDSRENHWRMENSDGSFLDMMHRDIVVSADDNITHKTRNYTIECDTYTTKAGSSHTVETGTMTETASGGKETNANTTHNGNIALNGDMDTKPGSGGATGSTRFAGGATFEQGVKVEGTLEAEHITTPTPIDAPNV